MSNPRPWALHPPADRVPEPNGMEPQRLASISYYGKAPTQQSWRAFLSQLTVALPEGHHPGMSFDTSMTQLGRIEDDEVILSACEKIRVGEIHGR